MIFNQFKTALRNLVKRRVVAAINLVGLSVSLALFIMIGLYIDFETSYDEFHDKSSHTYLLTKELKTPTSHSLLGVVNYPEGPLLADDYPQINQVVRTYRSDNSLTKSGDKVFMENDFYFVDKNFFDVFDFEIIIGSIEEAFSEVDNIFITEETAHRYFGRVDVLGEIIEVTEQYWNVTNQFKVVAIVKDVPLNSHIQFDFLANFDAFERLTGLDDDHQNPIWYWGWNAFQAYILVNSEVNVHELEEKLDGFIQKYYSQREKDISTLSLTPLEDIYLRPDLANGHNVVGNPDAIRVLSGIALFILVIACINFVNLTTARSSLYAREIGVKKILGASRSHLFFQLIAESTILTFTSIVLAVVMVEMSMPAFEGVVGKPLHIEIFTTSTLAKLVILGTVIGFFAGFYPGVVLSGFKPLAALQGQKGLSDGKFSVRKFLVVFQFTVSIVLVLGSIVIYRQLLFVTDKDLGFDQSEILYVEVPSGIASGDSILTARYEAIQARIRQLSKVDNVTSTEDRPGVFVGNEFVYPGGLKEAQIVMETMWVDDYFFETFDIPIIDGQLAKSDPGAPVRYYINESAKENLQWNDVLGKKIGVGSSQGIARSGFINGVFADFNFESLHSGIKPLMIGVWPNHLSSGRWNMFIKANTTAYNDLIEEVETIWSEYYPERPFNISFLDESIDQQYEAQTNMLKILPLMTGFAVFIACLGLFGLASFVVERKTKEVGIRKVLGASVSQIIGLISSDFMKLLVLANLIAWPLSYYFLNNWLSEFNYRIPLSWYFFIISGVLVMLVAFVTVASKIVKGAQSNPVDSLRYE